MDIHMKTKVPRWIDLIFIFGCYAFEIVDEFIIF